MAELSALCQKGAHTRRPDRLAQCFGLARDTISRANGSFYYREHPCGCSCHVKTAEGAPPMPSKRAREQQAARPARLAQLEEFPYCEPKAAGLLGECFGNLTVHEPWTRGRGGPLGDRRNMVTACERHNDALTQTKHGLQWGHEHGYLVHAHEGPAWLEAGGFKR